MPPDINALEEKVAQALRNVAFTSEDVVGKMIAGLEPVIGINIVEACPGRGQSKLGGKPHLPEGATWPSAHGESLAFVGQIAFADLKEHDFHGALPMSGLLSIFCIADEMFLEIEPDHRLLYHNVPITELVELDYPSELDEEEGRFEEKMLTFNPSFVLANPDDPSEEARFQWSDEKAFASVLADLGLGQDTRLLGRPYFFREEFEGIFEAGEDVLLFELHGDQLDRIGDEGSIYDEGVLRVIIPLGGLARKSFQQAGVWFEGGT